MPSVRRWQYAYLALLLIIIGRSAYDIWTAGPIRAHLMPAVRPVGVLVPVCDMEPSDTLCTRANVLYARPDAPYGLTLPWCPTEDSDAYPCIWPVNGRWVLAYLPTSLPIPTGNTSTR